MEVSHEAELENFLGKLIRRAWRGIRKVAGGVLRPLGGVLKMVAKRALPFLAGAAGTFFGGPVGGALGASVGSAISKALELEYEALEQEDKEYEMARSYVRMAASTARQAAMAPPNVSPEVAVRNALLAIVQRYWPGISLSGLGLAANGGTQARMNPAMGSSLGSWQNAGQPGGARIGSVQLGGGGTRGQSRSGRWVRRGQVIVLLGV
jgi:hypothetical protein